jgi:hypothetical protein
MQQQQFNQPINELVNEVADLKKLGGAGGNKLTTTLA